MALRNDYRLDVLNGTRGTITAIDLEHRHITVDSDGRGACSGCRSATSPTATSPTATP